MGAYTNIDIKTVEGILSLYGINYSGDITPTLSGISNSNFKINGQNNHCYLLKISNDKTVDQLRGEHAILDFLSAQGYRYSLAAIKTLSGNKVYQFEDHTGVIFPFVEATVPSTTKNTCREIAKALGELHNCVLDAADLSKIRPYESIGFTAPMIHAFKLSQEAPQDFIQAYDELFHGRLENISYEAFPKGILHGDLYSDNTLFIHSKLVHLIDFEQSGYGPLVLDLGIAITGCCFDEKKDQIDPDMMNEFISSYQGQRKLEPMEKAHLRDSILLGFFSISLWRIFRFYIGRLDATKKYNYRELLNRARNFSAKFESI